MKKKYSKKFICEAIAYWRNQLKKLNESSDDFTVQVDSRWFDKDEVEEEKRALIALGIHGSYHDGGDYYSSWTLVGPEDAVKKYVEDHYQNSIAETLPFDELVKEIGATVNGVEMQNELAERLNESQNNKH